MANLSYAEVLDYFADRHHDECTLAAYPTYSGGEGEGTTMLGLQIPVSIGKLGPIPEYLDDFVAGEGAASIALLGFDESVGSLVLVPSKFRSAEVTAGGAILHVVVEAGPMVGMGFTFDFDGSPPWHADGQPIARWTEAT